MASSGDLRSLLGPAIFSQIPNNAQVVLQQAWTSHTDTLKTNLEKVKVDAEQKIAELSSNNNELSSKLAVYTEETERGQTALQMYREQVIVFIFSYRYYIDTLIRNIGKFKRIISLNINKTRD